MMRKEEEAALSGGLFTFCTALEHVGHNWGRGQGI